MSSMPIEHAGIHTLTLPTPFVVGPVNTFLWKGDPLTLIDTGPRSDEAWEALQAALAAHGCTVADIERVILTHHHVDHAGLLARIIDASGAETWAHPAVPSESHPNVTPEEAWDVYFSGMLREMGLPDDVREQAMRLLSVFRTFSEPYHIDHVFDDGGQVGPFTAYHVPGHSVTDTLLVHHAEGYTLVGDHILETINPNPLIHRPERPGLPRPKSLVCYQHSLRRTRELELGRCYPGHGGPFDDHRRVVDGILAKHARRDARVRKHLRPEGVTPYEVALAMYPDLGPENLYLILSVAVGHLEVLEEAGEAAAEHRDGVLYYRPVSTG
jgi:glyoxylase-like metal-dependent hydrolase (beta-lactamase superfamily II)